MARGPTKKTRLVRKPRKHGPSPSTTGKVNPNVDQTNWRVKLQTSRIKFDDDQKEIYCSQLSKHGLKDRAAKMASVSPQTARKHLKDDLDFREAADIALNEYNDLIGSEVKRRGHDGIDKPLFYKGVRVVEPVLDENGVMEQAKGPNGELLFNEKTGEPIPVMRYINTIEHSDRMLELEAKRTNPEYRDKQTIDLNAEGGGVLVAPAGMTAEEFIQHSEEKRAEQDRLHEERMKELKTVEKG